MKRMGKLKRQRCGCSTAHDRQLLTCDKAKVEAGVLVVERWILARLRNRTFFSLAELNAAMRELLELLNHRPFKKLAYTDYLNLLVSARYHQAAETYRPLRYWPIALYARTLPLPRTSLPLVTYDLKLRSAPASDPTDNPSTCFVVYSVDRDR